MQPADPFVNTLQEGIEVIIRRSMRSVFLYSKESGLSMSQIGALFHIRRGACGVSDLGDGLGITPAAASQMLEHLVQQGLILRTEDPHDRRSKQIVLTDKGRQTLHDSIRARQGWLVDLAQILTEAEKEQIAAALQIMIARTIDLEKNTEPNRSR